MMTMGKLHPPFSRADMPPGVAALSLDQRGYPIPWFVAPKEDTGGVVDFRVMDGDKLVLAIRERRCWVCGEVMAQRVFAFPIGPMCAINRTAAEPPSHLECARWSVKACPFLSSPKRVRNEEGLPENRAVAGDMIKRNPGVIALWLCDSYKPFRPSIGAKGLLMELPDPRRVEWYCEGRAATRAEALHSVETGLPILITAATKDSEPVLALFELGRATERNLGYLPPETVKAGAKPASRLILRR